MKKLLLLFIIALAAFIVKSEELIIFENGKLNGKLGCKAVIKNNKLMFKNTDAIKLIFIPSTSKLAKYTQLEMYFAANRAKDKMRFTMTANPKGATKWNYYCADIQEIPSKGPQKITVDLSTLRTSRQPLSKDNIQSIEFNFTGWGMPYKKGLVLEIEKVVLTQKVTKAMEQIALEKKSLEKINSVINKLPLEPMVPVPNVSNRKYWNSIKTTRFAANVIKHAQKGLNTVATAPSTDYYLDFLRNGNRSRYEKEYVQLVQNYTNLTMAFCITNDKAKYQKSWNQYNDVLLNMATWVYPAHDSQLDNLLMRRPHIELVGSNTAATIATAKLLLAPYISKEKALEMQKAINRQILNPLLDMVQKKRKPDWCFLATNNWNAVCIANVVHTLLASDLSVETKKQALQFLLSQVNNYLKGFNKDGYCSEGISYWSYGFGHYLRLAALMYTVSQGKINLLQNPIAQKVSVFPDKFMLSQNQYFPAFADCSLNADIGDAILYLRNYLLGYPVVDKEKIASNMLYQITILGLPKLQGKIIKPFAFEQVSSFNDTGVFVLRNQNKNGLIIACKGGDNNELHNHNDVGSFSIAINGDVTLLGDLGGVVYTRDTFNKNRYKNPMLNSFGHPVPVIDNMLQTTGNGTKANVLKFDKNKVSALVTLDIKNAYNEVKGIKKLERTFVNNFKENGEVTIIDQGDFEHPKSFETALTTFGKITQIAPNKLLLEYRKAKLEITVDTLGIPWKLKEEVIKAETHWKDIPKRYAVMLVGNHKKVYVKTVINKK